MEKNDIESIVNHAKELKLGVIKDILDDILAEASEHQWSYSMFLNELLHREVEHRAENRKYQRIRKAGFPQMKYLHEIVREDLPDDARNLLPELESMNFIKEGRNVVMYGNPGTGKTHTAICLGIKACMEGFSVYFTTVPHLLTQIREARNSKALQLLETRFRKFDLVICDEMGYVSFDKEGAEMLFNHISMRAGVRIHCNHYQPAVHKMGGDHKGQGSLLRPCGQAVPQGFPAEHDWSVFQGKGNSKALENLIL